MNKAYTAVDVHPIYARAFNSGDIEATVACYESDGCFVAKSGRVARWLSTIRMELNLSQSKQAKCADARQAVTLQRFGTSCSWRVFARGLGGWSRSFSSSSMDSR